MPLLLLSIMLLVPTSLVMPRIIILSGVAVVHSKTTIARRLLLIGLIGLWVLLLTSCTTTDTDTFKATCPEIFIGYFDSSKGGGCIALTKCTICIDRNKNKPRTESKELAASK